MRCYLKAMKIFSNILLAVLLTISFNLILTLKTFAQQHEKRRGYKGTISKKELLLQLKDVNDKKDKYVEGFVIKGDDIIEIIKATDYEIRIKNSVIKGGLNFTKLPSVPLAKIGLPEKWDEKKRKEWIKQRRNWIKHRVVYPLGDENFYIVRNKIHIIDSEILPIQPNVVSVIASNTFFYEEALFGNTQFSGHITFTGAVFGEFASFEATFKGGASFIGVTFGSLASYMDSVFDEEVSFADVTFSGDAIFLNGIFRGETYFSGTTFGRQASFLDAIFSEKAFFDATFRGEANFRGAIFNELASFYEARFLDSLVIWQTEFRKDADFQGSEIKRLHYSSAKSRPISTKSRTIVEGRLDFRNATIKEAHFQDITFMNDVDFSDVEFFIVVFRGITFKSDSYFLRTKFSDYTVFEMVNFRKEANFTDAVFQGRKYGGKQKFYLSYVNFENLLIKWDQLPNPDFWASENERGERGELLSQILKDLEEIFRKQGQLSDANKAYYHRKRAELEEARKEGKKKAVFWLRLQKEIEWIFWGILCGYGTKIWWIVGWSAFFNLFFSILYAVKGDLKRQPHPKTKQEFVFKQRLFDLPKQYYTQSDLLGVKNGSVRKIINALRFSSVVFFKVGYRDTIISGKILGIDYKYIVWVQWALGFYLLASIVITLSNTLPIVNRLITGVF